MTKGLLSERGQLTQTRTFGIPVVVATTALCVGVGASLGFLHGFLAPELREFFTIDRARAGLLVSVYFGATGAASIVSGVLADRISAKTLIATSLAILACVIFAASQADSYLMLLLLSVAGGACYAPINTATNVVLARVVPQRQRGTASNAKTMGVPLLVSFGAFFAPVIGQNFSWRMPMLFSGVIALVACAVVLIVIPSVSSIQQAVVSRRPPSGFWRVPVAAFFLLIGSQPVYSWSISYLVEELQIGKFVAGSVIGTASIIGAINMVLLGRMSDRLGLSSRRVFLMGLTSALSISQILVARAAYFPMVVVVIAITVAAVSQLAAIGTMHALIIDLCPGSAGRGSGLTMTGYYFGALAAPVSFGFLADQFGYSWAWLYCAVCAAISLVFFWSVKWIRRETVDAG